jgi:hypothetical protein
MTDTKRRPVSSWPASLLPSLTLIALLTGGAMTTASSDSSQVVEMTVTDGR